MEYLVVFLVVLRLVKLCCILKFFCRIKYVECKNKIIV